MYNLKLMYDNLEIAHTEGFALVLNENVPKFTIPDNLFIHSKWVPYARVVDFISNRIPPSNRDGIEVLLKKIGLSEYDVMGIAKITKACLVEDPWWFKFEDSDNFREDCTRGRAGYPEYDEELAKKGILKYKK